MAKKKKKRKSCPKPAEKAPAMPTGPVMPQSPVNPIRTGQLVAASRVINPAQAVGAVKYDGAVFNIDAPVINDLLREYNEKLLELGFGLSRRELRQKDMVDIRELLDVSRKEPWEAPNPGLDVNEKLFCVDNYYYSFLPCFDEGVLRVNHNRYIYWNVAETDFERHYMTIYLHDYAFYEQTGWQPGVSCTVVWKFADPVTERAAAENEHRAVEAEYSIADGEDSYADIYQAIDVIKTLKWTPYRANLWENTIVAYAKRCANEMQKTTGRTNSEELANLFTSYIIRVNYELYINKPKRAIPEKKPENPAGQNAGKAKTPGTKPPPERKIHTIGRLTVTSKTIPKPGGHRRPPNYTAAQWNTRGHIRTYKNGKKVYVKASVHKRKCLKDAQIPVPQIPVTIKFRKTENEPDAQKGSE